ncbi:hypothetical protein ACFL50_01285 [Candidatus Latescibacterota bacterium]
MAESLLKNIMEESIQLELKIAELYKLFIRTFPKDAYFWWELSEEEKNHAARILAYMETNNIPVQKQVMI